jgi:hypothetical protein
MESAEAEEEAQTTETGKKRVGDIKTALDPVTCGIPPFFLLQFCQPCLKMAF